MATLTWLGEDELHNGGAGPSFTHAFGGIIFPKGEAVEVNDRAIVEKARNNPFFEVEGEAEQGTGLDGLKVSELRAMAEDLGVS